MLTKAFWRAMAVGIVGCIALSCHKATDDKGTDAGSDGDTGTPNDTDSNAYVDCPGQPPNDADECDEYADGQTRPFCSWGDDPRYRCRTRAECRKVDENNWEWSVTAPSSEQCGELLPSGCPGEAPTARDLCHDDGIACYYGDGEYCVCTKSDPYPCYPVCAELDDPIWQCVSPPATDGCPAVLPNAGTECQLTSGTECRYTCEHIMVCQDGVWTYYGDQCPICAAPDTPIATPDGERPIAELMVGDVVYSVEGDHPVAVPLVRAARTRVYDHYAVQVILGSGSVLLISAAHPTADGREFKDLAPGGSLDSQEIIDARMVSYPYDFTYDILPDSSTGYYFAAGALIGSTLAP